MFMDSCAAGTHQLTKDSPSSKLLFYRDVQKYKNLVEKFVRKKKQLNNFLFNKFL
jgi:plexin A